MRPHVTLGLLSCVVLILSACYYDNEEELYPGGCNVNNVTYSGTIVPILTNTCISCHDAQSASGGVNLDGYDNVRESVDNGALLGSIKHDVGFSPMPDGAPQLSGCEIQRVETWVNAGAPDN